MGSDIKAEIKVGNFYLTECHDDTIWLEHESGEGMQIDPEQLLKLIDEFWIKNF